MAVTHSKQKDFLDQYTNSLIATSGKVLRVDHTYKIASALSAMDTELHKRVQIKASLLSILNEKGQVLICRLVPSDERAYMVEEFINIWSFHKTATTTHIFTDDSRKDINFVAQAWKIAKFPSSLLPKTCQDIWHVIHRIDSVLAHNHPDYYSAKQELSGIFAHLSNSSSTSSEQLVQQLYDWMNSYKQSHRDNDKQMKLFIENLLTVISGSGTQMKPADYPSIITTKVEAAINNLTNTSAGYIDAILNSTSLKDHAQGTSVNENWHKYLKKSSPFYSVSCSHELLVAIIGHLQFLYNYSKEMQSKENQQSNFKIQVMLSLKLNAPFEFNSKTSLTQLLTFCAFQDLKLSHFTTRKANYPKVTDEDIQKCIDGLKTMSMEKEGISQGLLYFIQHYIFDEKYSEGYVRKVLYQVAKKTRKMQ